MAKDTKKTTEQPGPAAVAPKKTLELPKKGKVRIESKLTNGLFRGNFDGLPINVEVPVNAEQAVKLGETVEVSFDEVHEGHAIEARYRPDMPIGRPDRPA